MLSDQHSQDALRNLHHKLDINFALQAAGLGVWELDPRTNTVIWDDKCRSLFGLAKDNLLPYEQAIAYIHPDDLEQVNQAVQWAVNPQSGGVYDQTYRTIGADDGQLRWVRFQGRAYVNPSGQLVRFAGIAQEVTPQLQAQQRLAVSEASFRSLIEEAPVPTMLLTGPDHTIELANPAMLAMLGKDASIVGQPATDGVPELAAQAYLSLLDQVMASGVAYEAKAMPGELRVNGTPTRHYFDFTYKPLRNPEGQVYGILSMAVDVTQQVIDSQRLQETLSQMRSLVESAPFPIGVYTGRDMRIQLANQSIIDVFGKGPDVIGKSYLELLPELAGQQIFEQLQAVYQTGTPFASGTQRVNIEHQGKLVPYYFNYNFTPLFDAQGQVYGVMNTAADVTPLELARQQVAETATALQSAVELAELGTWTMDIGTGTTLLSQRHADMFGLPTTLMPYEQALAIVHPDDRDPVREAFLAAMRAGSDGHYAAEYRIVNASTGRQQIIRARGETSFDEQGQPVHITGTTQDITLERETQAALEHQVQQRTDELAAANEELTASNEEYAAINEEYATINEELEEANGLLLRSNDSLQTFAYVASHDLQEPLRKIQQFGNLLHESVADRVSGQDLVYLERMQSAAARMSALIKDLLNYSRISTQRPIDERVDLNAVLSDVLGVLDLAVAEAHAQVQVDVLPVVAGDSSQLGQLFQNLLSNALKFHRPDVVPQIRMSSQTLKGEQLPFNIKPARRSARYHRIEVADNGIGFDEKYLSRIFQVFQRLHGKNEYMGTGIGLAICEKVVANHGGVITASSQPGQGATFSVYLPA